MAAPTDELVAAGRAALRSGDVAAARRALEQVTAEARSGDVVEALARTSFIELDFAAAAAEWERAYALHRRSDDAVGAIRVARSLANIHGTVMGDWAVASGWIARAQTLLADAVDSSERGWVALNLGMFTGDRERKERHFREALQVARERADADLELVALAYLGASLVHGGNTTQGMALLDEALAAVAGSEVDDFIVLEEIFCQLFAACEHAYDITRADQWIRIGEAIAERRRLPAVSAFCRTHYGGVLTAAGRWSEADAALTAAVRLWELGHRSALRRGALVRLAALRIRQGRLEEAEQLLDGMDVENELDAAHPLAALHLARGATSLAADALERALVRLGPSDAAAGPLLALLADVHLADGRHDRAAEVVEQLLACAARHPTDYLVGLAALARGRVCLVAGTGDPQACLREALTSFARARMPVELARARLQLATALQTERPEVALAEAQAALDAFGLLESARDVDAAAALLRSLGVRPRSNLRTDGQLTRREAEVLDLLGHGLSNAEIAERLFISRKTVEHHVGNVLAKLGLRSRTEAAAWVIRKNPAGT